MSEDANEVDRVVVENSSEESGVELGQASNSNSEHENENENEQKQQERLSAKDEQPTTRTRLDTNDEGHVSATQQKYRNWPSIYTECRFNLNSSILVYALADIRKAIRSGKISEPEIIEELMNFPSSSESIVPVLLKHKEVFLQLVGGEAFSDVFFSDREIQRAGVRDGEREDGVIVYEMDDANEKSEIVWGIGLNHIKERIQIVFRGSATMRDAIADLDPLMGWFPNPVESSTGHPQAKRIGIQLGFAIYMNGKTKNLGEGKTKKIRERVLELLKEHPAYSVYCTGHSLGGALASLMAFDLATSSEIPKPVSLVSVAAPKVGNIDYRCAIQALEKKGLLRCLRVANSMDVIPEMPTKAFCCADCCCACCLLGCTSTGQSHLYWHAGTRVILYNGGKCRVHYDKTRMTYWERIKTNVGWENLIKVFANLGCACSKSRQETGFLKNHSCKEYSTRLDAAKGVLGSMYLHDLHFKENRQSIMKMKRPTASDILRIQGRNSSL